MDRPLVENTVHGGFTESTTITDMVRVSSNKYLNSLYAFIICVDGGDFDFGRVKTYFSAVDPSLLPNISVFLNKGVVMYGKHDKQKGFSIHKYPLEVAQSGYDWFFAEGAEAAGGSIPGTHLAILYGTLIEHLSNSHLDPPNAYRYTRAMSAFRRSSLIWAKDRSQ